MNINTLAFYGSQRSTVERTTNFWYDTRMNLPAEIKIFKEESFFSLVTICSFDYSGQPVVG